MLAERYERPNPTALRYAEYKSGTSLAGAAVASQVRNPRGHRIHQAVAVTGMRRARYLGLQKIHLEHVFSAVALSLIRLDAW